MQLLAILTRTSSARIVHRMNLKRISYKNLPLADKSLRIGTVPLQIPLVHHLLEHQPPWARSHLILASSFTLGGVTEAEVKHHIN